MEVSGEDKSTRLMRLKTALEHLPPQVHWFCPTNDAVVTVDNVPVKSEESEVQHNGVEAFEADHRCRQNAFNECLEFFAYDGIDVYPILDFFKREIERNLERCDRCIVGYYKSKIKWLEHVEATEDTEALVFVAEKLDNVDIDRIVDKLDSLSLTLRDSDVVRHPARSWLLDALSCESFLSIDDRVRQHFDRPFRHLWEKALPHVECYFPGATMFLFDLDPSRRNWALSTWSGFRMMSQEVDFNFAIRNPLLSMLRTASALNDSINLERFWVGIGTLISHIDNNLITHSLRALDAPDIFKLTLEHLHCDARGLRHILQALNIILETAPKDYWESMGTISPTTVVENIFNSHFTTLVAETWENEAPAQNMVKELFAWIRPFVDSLETVLQSQACRAIAAQLLKKLQEAHLPLHGKIECWRRGLDLIRLVLSNCNKEHPIFAPTGRVVAAETLGVVSEYIESILSMPALPVTDPWYKPCATISLDVVELALTLECKSLRTDQETLRNRRDIDPGTCSYGPAIWDRLVQRLVDRNVDLARTALTGISGLMGLEKFVTVQDETNRKYKSDYNVKLSHLTHLVCQMLEQINDFEPKELDRLFRKPATATALVAPLFSPDASTYEAGVNLMKTISSESVRQDAIRHVVISFFDTTLDAMSRSIRRIAKSRVYASCPRMLKTCKDVLEILCDSQLGLLRSRTLQGPYEVTAVENFWQQQWEVLKVIYEMTETWSKAHVADSDSMKEFVRDTMDFSERLLDQYSMFASAIGSANMMKKEKKLGGDDTAVNTNHLLDPPAKTMEVIVRWLRLRDLYLVDVSVKLTKKALDRLAEKGMVLAQEPSDFLELIIRGGANGRTNLEPQQKAELARALEANLGRPILPTESDKEDLSNPEYQNKSSRTGSIVKKAKNGVIDLDNWRAKAASSPKIIDIPDDDEFGDSDITDADILKASRSIEGSNKTSALKLSERPSSGLHKGASTLTSKLSKGTSTKSAKQLQADQAKQAEFREKRKKDVEAKKKRDAEAAALLRRKAPGQAASLGIEGKDHAPKQSGVMVSDSGSDSDDDIDKELFGSLTKVPKISEAVREYQADRLRALREQGPVKKNRLVRSAKDMRARLAPDLTALHKTILGWEYFNSGEFPPGSGRSDYSLVTNTFRNPRDYQNVFEPLLALEGWQAFLKSKEEGSAKTFDIVIANRVTVDAFVEVATTLPHNEGRELGISEADVVLMSKGESPATEAQQPHCLARVFKISRKKTVMEITYRVNVGNALLPSMAPKATLRGVKILSLTPLEREYGALLGLQYFDLCEEIIKAKPSPILQYSEKQLEMLVSKYLINPAQAKAVRSAIDNDAFTLIQGPPGSGKTKTIVAIVGALLTGQFDGKGTVIARPQTTGQNTAHVPRPTTAKKLLVCAPSNAAVDELVMRFKEGVKTLNGTLHKPSIVRLGRSDAINSKVVDVTLEELVKARLNTTSEKKTQPGEDLHQLMLAHKSACDEFNTLRATVDALKASGKSATPEQEREFEVLKRKKQQLSTKIDSTRDSGDSVARDIEINRRKVQQEILDGAHVLCATLSGSGHEMFQSLNIEFETVIIDEAAQSIELSALIPLKYGCAKCILVGDPKQLPPTVLSREAARFQYEQSLFVRMQGNHPDDVHLLDTQYRMHPEISMFPSREFYDGRLLDGAGMDKQTAKPWHQSAILGPYRFFDVRGTQQSAPRGHSLINIAEVEMALKLFTRLTTDCRGYDFTGKIGIITPYKSQLRELRSRFAREYGDSIFAIVEFNSTDAFQGRECEVIIFSCVRASVGRGIGFMSDIRRMNVGITRAKSSLWVLGNSQSLMQGEYWGRLIEDARRRDRYSGQEALDLLQHPLVKSDSASALKPGTNLKLLDSSTAGDIEMVDAPPGDSSLRQSTESGSFSRSKEHIPSGGMNGLNPNRSCSICGSTMHYHDTCDNLEAIASSRGGCFRCGALDHDKGRCTAERCVECGAFGHTKLVCTSTTILSKADKDKIKGQEAAHQRSLQRQTEKARIRQLGDHDRKVPTIVSTLDAPKATNSTKRSEQQATQSGKKRPREPSPPANAPKQPRAANGPSQNAGNGSKRPRDSGSFSHGLKHNLPLRSPTLNSGRRPSTSSHQTPSQPQQNRPTPPEPPPKAQAPEIPTLANSKLESILRDGAHEEDMNAPTTFTPRLKAALPNVKPPMKKKKQTDPFIVPNKKRR